MKHYAYLIAWIDLSTTPLTVAGAGIYSEETPSTTLRRFPAVIAKSPPMPSYELARQTILQLIEGPYYTWVRSILPLSFRG